MALASSKLNELLPLLPPDVQEKTSEIYNRIPGTLFQFFAPQTISKKAECHAYDLVNEKSFETNDNQYLYNIHGNSNDPINEKMDHHEITKPNEKPSTEVISETKFTDNTWYTTPTIKFKDDKDWNNLRLHLRDSIGQVFHHRQITEISANILANEISTKCLEQCPNWGKHQENSSTIIRFNTSYIRDEKLSKMNINVYVYGYIRCEFDTSFRNIRNRNEYKTSYDLTMELTGISINTTKIEEFCQLVNENSISDSIKALETKIKLTWNDLNDRASNQSIEEKSSLT